MQKDLIKLNICLFWLKLKNHYNNTKKKRGIKSRTVLIKKTDRKLVYIEKYIIK